MQLKREIADAKLDEKAIEEARQKFAHNFEQNQVKFIYEVTNTLTEKLPEIEFETAKSVVENEENAKKKKSEDDTRARLRGFARTIPSFLMAYGSDDTCLANFDEIVDADVFEEVTGITVDDFRVLRDEGRFFDEVVFNEACREFLNRKEKLSNYFETTATEDIFDYIPPQKTNQIFTPCPVVTKMLDLLEAENPGIFADPTKTFADLYVKSGLYLTEIAKRLFKGLAEEIPDENARLKHIFENQLFGFAPTPIIFNIAKNYVFGFEGAESLDTSNLIQLDLTPFAKGEEELPEGVPMKFDCIVGNPPYQEDNDNNGRKSPIYNFFMDLAFESADKVVLISPARFLSNSGQTPATWNNKMLENEHFNVLYHWPDSADVFPNNDIKGGVAITSYDAEKEIGPIGTFIPFEELQSIHDKVMAKSDEFLDSIISSRGLYRTTEKFFEDFSFAPERLGQGTGNMIASNFFDRVPECEAKNSDLSINYGFICRSNNERTEKFIDKTYVIENEYLSTWNVVVPKSNGSGALGEVLSTPMIGQPMIGQPMIGHTDTFISVGKFYNEFEATSLLKYLEGKFARCMLGILKTTQDNPRSTWAKVPLQDFTPHSDINWTAPISDIDKQLYKKYNLDEAEVAFIEEKVKAME